MFLAIEETLFEISECEATKKLRPPRIMKPKAMTLHSVSQNYSHYSRLSLTRALKTIFSVKDVLSGKFERETGKSIRSFNKRAFKSLDSYGKLKCFED